MLVPALERGDGQVEAVVRQVLHRRQHRPVDLAGPDVVASACVDREAGVGKDLALE